MKVPKISVIVPVYKVEKYIHRCVESVISQTYANFELLLIDDGSPDKSGNICDEYAAKDERISVIHQKNKGVSAARNIALETVNGEYVLFLDSDDWLDINCLKFCVNEMDRTNADIMQFPMERTSKENNDTVVHIIEQANTYTVDEYIATNDYLVSIGGSAIRTNIIQSNNIRFRKDIKLAEDQLFIMECIKFSKIINRSYYPLYKYYTNETSATNNSKSETMVYSISALVEYKRKHPQFKKIIDQTLLYFILYIINNNDLPLKELCKLIKKANIARNKKFSWIENIFVVLAEIAPILSILFIHVYKSFKA